ncbi:MAG: Omp28-related outer membrane protein [Flavobacteriales bacterium]
MIRPNTQTYLTWFIASLFLFAGCDKIENPVVKSNEYDENIYGAVPTFIPELNPLQRVLLEDFTGHECGNCPKAHIAAKNILASDTDRVAVVAIHAGSLAQPFPPTYPEDFTTTEGTYYLLTQVGSDQMPKGRINRFPNANNVTNYPDWSDQVDSALQSTPLANMQLKTDFQPASSKLNIHVFTNWLESFSGQARLIVLVTENGIIAPQLTYIPTPPITDTAYHHEHVLRRSATGATGLVAFNNPQSGASKTDSYTIDWNPNWVPENCEVIAFLTNGLDGDVINVAKTKVIP